MAKPWFKFNVSKWNDGEISLEKYHIRGMFIAVCSYFWSRECHLTRDTLTKKFGKKVVEILSSLQYISIVDDKVSIPFLDEEWADTSEKREISIKNGQSGGRPKTGQEPAGFTKKTQYREDKSKIREEESVLPFGPAFASSWGEWVQHRKEKREALKPTTIKKQLKMLSSMSEEDAIGVINYSITGGYTGLFPDRVKSGKVGLPNHL